MYTPETLPTQRKCLRVVELRLDYIHEAYYSLAIIQNDVGKGDECRKNLEQALTTKPDYKEAKDFKCK